MDKLILNLVYPSMSNVSFHISKFPDGQQDLRVEEYYSPFFGGKSHLSGYSVGINARLNNFKDLELIICAVRALRNVKVTKIGLFTPYMMGSRSDRDFTKGHGGTNYIKQVLAPIINELKLDYVSVLDPHSDVMEACIDNLNQVPIDYFYGKCLDELKKLNVDDFYLVSPDAGAYKKVSAIAPLFGITDSNNILSCSKIRDLQTSQILATVVPKEDIGKDCVIVDDICDGGRTFTELSKALKARGAKRVFLVVTHGIFSAGINVLREHLSGVFSTNSYTDLPEEEDNFLELIQIF